MDMNEADFAARCADIVDRLKALLPHATAIDEVLNELVPAEPQPKRRRNSVSPPITADGLIYSVLFFLPHGRSALVPKLTEAIDNIEDIVADEMEEATRRNRAELAALEAQAEELRHKLGLLPREPNELGKRAA